MLGYGPKKYIVEQGNREATYKNKSKVGEFLTPNSVMHHKINMAGELMHKYHIKKEERHLKARCFHNYFKVKFIFSRLQMKSASSNSSINPVSRRFSLLYTLHMSHQKSGNHTCYGESTLAIIIGK